MEAPQEIPQNSKNLSRNKIVPVFVYTFAALGLVAALYLIAGTIAVKFGGVKVTPSISISPQTVKPSPTPFVPVTPEQRANHPFPSVNIWNEYKPTCVALASNVRIFLPDGWKQSSFGEQDVVDGIDSTDPQEIKDFQNLVVQCQIIIGFPEDPGSHQAPGPKEAYGRISVNAMRIRALNDEQSSLDWWKHRYAEDPGYTDAIDSVVEETINGKRWLLIHYAGMDWWETIQNGYLINVEISSSNVKKYNALLNGYIQKTGEDLRDKLIFK